jgi:hypothetical protein
MTVEYQHDIEAQAAAAKFAITGPARAELANACGATAERLGGAGVGGHRIAYSVDAWKDLIASIDGDLAEPGSITRAEVFAIAQGVAAATRPLIDLFTGSYLWGMGTTGYGADRYRKILDRAGERLEPSLASAWKLAQSDHPAFAYSWLFGGADRRERKPSTDATTGRLDGYGPAFFTKFLYFASEGTALILDARLAHAVHKLSGMPNLVRAGRPVPWTAYRYTVYLHWMRQTSSDLRVNPDLLELTLFAGVDIDLDDPHSAAE